MNKWLKYGLIAIAVLIIWRTVRAANIASLTI